MTAFTILAIAAAIIWLPRFAWREWRRYQR